MLAVCGLLGLPAGAEAQQRTLGTNLQTHTPNANFDCRTRPSVVGPQFFGAPDNCTYVGSSPGEQSTGAPGPGVITRVRVRAAAPTGPMRVTIARATRSTTAGFACCFFQGQSQVFTPRPNRITGVNVRLPVSAHIDFNAGIETVDYLGLTVLANNVAIPGQYPGNNDFEGSLGFFPRLGSSPSDADPGRVDGYGNSLIPLLSADWVPICGPSGGGRVAQGGRCLTAIGFRGRSGSLDSGSARIPLICNVTIQCRGRLTLKRRGGQRIGGGRIRIAPGGRKRVKAQLNDAGREFVQGKAQMKVRARAKFPGVPAANRTVKLRR